MTRASPRWLGGVLALAGIALFMVLGTWQLQRAGEKQAMLDAAAQVLEQRRDAGLMAAADPARLRDYDWATGEGRFAPYGPLWLDNQQRNGRVGVRVYRVFLPEDRAAPLLVDLGWLPLAGARVLPPVPRPEGLLTVRGLLVPPPSPGLRMGSGMVAQDEGWLLTRLEPAAISTALGQSPPLAARVLRLDPALPLGYERDLDLLPNTLPPERHLGYAVQWFALAAAVLVLALVLTWRGRRRPRKEPPG